MEISTEMVKALRQATGAGVLDCHKALETYAGDFEKAAAYLREKGLSEAARRSERAVSEGIVEVYGHPGNRVGVILEVNCETDFVARTEEFQTLAHDLALHIAFAAPHYISQEQVPPEVVEAERAVYRAQALAEGKPEHIVERIVEGRLQKFYQTVCLLQQPFVRDEERTVEDVLKDYIARLGENIVIRRFARYELGKDL